MNIIPVVDYMNGSVVSAVKGERKNYRPIRSKLCYSADVYDVISAYLSFAEFDTIYIADLDSIENRQLDTKLWPALFANYQNIQFWLDLGTNALSWKKTFEQCSNARPVVGSESYNNVTDLLHTLQLLTEWRPLLSLDFKFGCLQGTADLFDTKQALPEEIILLSLGRVGSAEGPDVALYQSLHKQLKNHRLYLGGGIRDANDLSIVKSLRIAGVLVANAFHTGMIRDFEVRRYIS